MDVLRPRPHILGHFGDVASLICGTITRLWDHDMEWHPKSYRPQKPLMRDLFSLYVRAKTTLPWFIYEPMLVRANSDGSCGTARIRMLTWTVAGRTHYENMPIQIYWKFHLQKLKVFR